MGVPGDEEQNTVSDEDKYEDEQTYDNAWAPVFEQWLSEKQPATMSRDDILTLDKAAQDTTGHAWERGMEELRSRGRCSQEYIAFFYGMEDNSAFVKYAQVPQAISRGTFSTENGVVTLPDTSPDTLRRMLLEVTVSRDVETFLYYLTQILRRIFSQRPEVLVGFLEDADDRRVDVREVLQCQDRQEFVRLIAGRLVDALGYKGLGEIVRRLNLRMKLGYNAETADFRDAQEVIEVRNIIAHNAGCVSRQYLQRTKRTGLQEGQLYPLTEDYVVDAGYKLIAVAGTLDELFNLKFQVAM